MRAYFFTEMPYPSYSLEAEERAGSQRVVLPNSNCDPEIVGDLYNRYLDEYEYADELGLDLMLNEHHQTPSCLDSVMPLSAAALARRTKRARILLLGTPLAHRDNPVRVAEELAFPRLCVPRAPHQRLRTGGSLGDPSGQHKPGADPRAIRGVPRPDPERVDRPRAL